MIAKYDTFNKGYNSTISDSLCFTHSKETKEKIKKTCQEHLNKTTFISGRIPWNKGKKIGPQSEETKKKMSLAKLGKKRGPYKKI